MEIQIGQTEKNYPEIGATSANFMSLKNKGLRSNVTNVTTPKAEICHIRPSDVVIAVVEALKDRFVGAARGDRQRLHCPQHWNHRHGDQHPSAWLNLRTGWVNCAVCGAIPPSRVVDVPVEGRSSGVDGVDTDKEAVFDDVYSALPPAGAYARERGLHAAACTAYGLRGGDGHHVPYGDLAIPYIKDGHVVGIKIRMRAGDLRYRSLPGSTLTLFGRHLCRSYGGLLLVSEGELNAVSLFQSCGQVCDVVSIGGGRAATAVLQQLVEVVRHYDYRKVVVWCDRKEDAESIRSQLLSSTRAKVASIETKTINGDKYDANTILQRYGSERLAEIIVRCMGGNGDSAKLFARTQGDILDSYAGVDCYVSFSQWWHGAV